MNKNKVKGLVIFLQAFLVAALFLPAGTITESAAKNDATLSVFEMIDRYAGMGFSDDARFYMILACVFPVAIIVSVLFIKERINYEAAIVISALYSTASACFYSAAKRKMVDYATMTYLPHIIIFVSLVSLLLLILGFFLTTPGAADAGNSKRSN